jgi:ubiquinone/menaquinone biosynthesis C-methylase UbiE
LGAGTGRLTRLFSSEAKTIFAFDISIPMLIEARSQLEVNRRSNYALCAADNRQIPISEDSGDLIVVGWSLGHFVSWYPDNWLEEINRVMLEMKRVLRPGGAIIILETLGTGQERPKPPTSGLANYYTWLENVHGFSSTWIRTDYRFASVVEAEHLTRFFFGDELADQIVSQDQITLPECTGIWWLTN